MPIKNINGIKLNYSEFGNRSKQTIVFAHPALFDSTVFEAFVSALRADFHIILLDVHGHGSSGYRSPLTLEEMTADYDRLLAGLDLSNVTWIGCSVGGMIGMRLALKLPDVIGSLILMATPARLDPPQIRDQTWWLWQMFRAGHRDDIVDAALRFFFAPITFSNQPELIASHRAKILNYRPAEARGMFEVARAVMNRTDISEGINSIAVPTLVIGGKEDLAPAPAETEFIASSIPNAQLAIVDHASHLLVVEQPQEVLGMLRQFLQGSSVNLTGASGEKRDRDINPSRFSGVSDSLNDRHRRHGESLSAFLTCPGGYRGPGSTCGSTFNTEGSIANEYN